MSEPLDALLVVDARPSRADALKNRQLLLETAARLFDAQGVDAVTMSAVAQAAGVGKGTLYRHFASKTDLCHALLDHEQQELQERILRRLRLASHPPLDDLRWFSAQVLAFVTRHLPLLRTIDNSTAFNHPAHYWWRQTIRALLIRAQVPGDVDYQADLLYVMLDPLTVHYQRTVQGYTHDRILSGINHLLDHLTN